MQSITQRNNKHFFLFLFGFFFEPPISGIIGVAVIVLVVMVSQLVRGLPCLSRTTRRFDLLMVSIYLLMVFVFIYQTCLVCIKLLEDIAVLIRILCLCLALCLALAAPLAVTLTPVVIVRCTTFSRIMSMFICRRRSS